jgi:DNA-binding CsgD family transcriptional regulator
MARARRRGRPPHDDVLTPAEWRVVHAVRHGMTNAEIARRRGVSLDAVKFHVANAVAKLGLRNRRELRRWDGIPKHSALYGSSQMSKASPLRLGPIGQLSRTVKDIGAAERWYREVLGLPHLYTFGKLAFFDCGGTRLFLTEQDEQPAADSIIYWRVADIQSAYGALLARGIEFHAPPHMIFRHPDGLEEWMAFFKDPEGRPLAIMAQVSPSRPVAE